MCQATQEDLEILVFDPGTEDEVRTVLASCSTSPTPDGEVSGTHEREASPTSTVPDAQNPVESRGHERPGDRVPYRARQERTQRDRRRGPRGTRTDPGRRVKRRHDTTRPLRHASRQDARGRGHERGGRPRGVVAVRPSQDTHRALARTRDSSARPLRTSRAGRTNRGRLDVELRLHAADLAVHGDRGAGARDRQRGRRHRRDAGRSVDAAPAR